MFTTYLPTKMPIFKRKGILLLMRLRRLLNSWVAATIARDAQELCAVAEVYGIPKVLVFTYPEPNTRPQPVSWNARLSNIGVMITPSALAVFGSIARTSSRAAPQKFARKVAG